MASQLDLQPHWHPNPKCNPPKCSFLVCPHLGQLASLPPPPSPLINHSPRPCPHLFPRTSPWPHTDWPQPHCGISASFLPPPPQPGSVSSQPNPYKQKRMPKRMPSLRPLLTLQCSLKRHALRDFPGSPPTLAGTPCTTSLVSLLVSKLAKLVSPEHLKRLLCPRCSPIIRELASSPHFGLRASVAF